MALITRVSRLFRADVHAVLDRIEEPDLLLRQALREMEEVFASDQQQLKLLKHELHHLETRGKRFEQALKEMDDELDICFSSQQEDLAKALIRRKLETQRHLKQIEEKHGTTHQACSTLEQRLSEQRSQLENMRQKVELLAEEPTSSSHDNSWQSDDWTIRDDEIEIAFLKEKQRRNPS